MKEYRKKIDAGIGSISIFGFYDEEWNSWRYSWACQIEGCYMGSVGYENDNSVAYPTAESAIESAICAIAGQDMALRRDMKMKIMLEI
jgi:hypothetical protein